MKIPRGIVYDTGALVAAQKNNRGFWAQHVVALRNSIPLTVPTVVFAQAWRGPSRSVNISRLIKGCILRDLDPGTAKRAGELCAAAGTEDIVDATVVAVAVRLSYAVVTSDPGDITKLVNAADEHVDIRAI